MACPSTHETRPEAQPAAAVEVEDRKGYTEVVVVEEQMAVKHRMDEHKNKRVHRRTSMERQTLKA